MTSSKSTKRALIASALVMVVCVSMFVAATFAWFTDTASTSVNKITSGNLSVAIQDEAGNELTALDWVTADSRAQSEILWEPGCTYTLTPFKVVNTGNLALKYKITITGLDGDSKLLDAIKFTYTDEDGNVFNIDSEGHLAANAETSLITVSAHMDEASGSEYQGLTLDGIKFTVCATQDTVEYDSYNNTYDEKAEYATPVTTTEELAAAIANGEDVVLENDIELPSALEITSDVTIYGNGRTKLINDDRTAGNTSRVINIESPYETGDLHDITLTLSGVDLIGPDVNGYNRAISAWGIRNLNIVMDNCTASANHYALNIAAANENVNVVVRNTTLTGYSAFQNWSVGTNATFENCTLIGLNRWGAGSNDYATIVICASSWDGIYATDTTLTFKNCRIEATEQDTALEEFLMVQTGATGANVTFDGCSFFKNGVEVTGDAIKDNMSIQSDTVLTIK